MPASASDRRAAGRRKMLRTRLLVFFIAPVLLCGAGMIVLAEIMLEGPGGPISTTSVRMLYAGILLLGLLLATGLALYVGERVTQPIARLLRAMDAGGFRRVGRHSVVAADWEMGVLAERVEILLQQNRSGAQAVEQLDALREEVAAVLHEATEGSLDPGSWPPDRASHPLTRQLLDFFRGQTEEADGAVASLRKLQGLLEQDWREETRCIEEIVGRTERNFIEQTQVAIELEKIGRLWAREATATAPQKIEMDPAAESDAVGEIGCALTELRLGFERWSAEQARTAAGVAGGCVPRPDRMEGWVHWIEESLTFIDQNLEIISRRPPAGAAVGLQDVRMRARLRELAALATRAGQGVGSLSREVAQLQRTWERLGERLRSLMARAIEARDRAALPALTFDEDDARVHEEDDRGGATI